MSADERINQAYCDGYFDGRKAQWWLVLRYINKRRNENATLEQIHDEIGRATHEDIEMEIIQKYQYKPG